MPDDKFRIGLVVEETRPPAWIARVIREVEALPFVTLVGLARARNPAPAQPTLANLYDAVDRRVFGVANDPLAPTAVDVPVVDDLPRDLDVVIDFTSQPGDAPARFGVWSYVFGDGRTPSGFWEVMKRSPVTTSALVMRRDGEERVLYESWSRTDPMSARRNRAACYWKSAAFVGRALRELHAHGAAALEHKPRRAVLRPESGSTREIVRGLVEWGGGILVDRVRRASGRKQWLLAYGITGESDVPSSDLEHLRWLVPPKDRFWADPFVVARDDGWTVFLEEKLYARRDAHISAFEVDRDGNVGEPFRVLERDYHLSYPFVFEWNGSWWMIPESARNHTVELWRATEFPRRWTLERTLLDNVHAVDATLFEHAGSWWMFCNIGEPHASKDDELHLFFADTPLGPWTPHPNNPIKSDTRSARPAGRPYRHDGVWHRPAQDCSGAYGSAIVIHRIDALSRDAYAETEITRLRPWEPGIIGLHTINAARGLTVIDLRVWRSRFDIEQNRHG